MPKYLIINCGYTSRLIEPIRAKLATKYGKHLAYIWDTVWGSPNPTFYNGFDKKQLGTVLKTAKLRNSNVSSGTIGFKYDEKSSFSPLGAARFIQQFDHCAMFFHNRTYGDQKSSNPIIKDKDLPYFEKRSKILKHGTLHGVTIRKNVMILEYDSESG